MTNTVLKRWGLADFDAMSWHDNAVHALRIVEGEYGEGALLLDIDYIEEWVPGEEHFEFLVCPAVLEFHQVTDLKIVLDYVTPTAGVCPFTLDRVEREVVEYPNGNSSFSWVLHVNWPRGELSFHSPAFSQSQRGPALRLGAQSLTPEQRGSAGCI